MSINHIDLKNGKAKISLVLLLVMILFLVGCKYAIGNSDVEIGRDYCFKDSDCVLKPEPYCCTETVEFVDKCYFVNDFPERINCDGFLSCPGLINTIGCKCENNKCIDVYGF